MRNFNNGQIACIDEHNPFFRMIRDTCGQRLLEIVEGFDHPRWDGGDVVHPLMVSSPR